MKGFSLIEAMVASAIAAVVLAVASSSAMQLYTQLRQESAAASMYDDAKLITDALTSITQQAGGGLLRAGRNIELIRGPDGASDRIVVTTLDANSERECTVSSVTNNNRIAILPDTDDDGLTTGCCLSQMDVGQEIVFVSSSGEQVSAKIKKINIGTCSAETIATSFPDSGTLLDRNNSSLVMVERYEFFHDQTSRELRMRLWQNGSTEVEEVALSDEVESFQVALGYDLPSIADGSGDGKISDANSISDEWFGNHQLDSAASFAANVSDLRMVRFGLILGRDAKGNRKTQKTQVIDSATLKTNQTIQTVTAETAVRNTYAFQ